MVKRAKSKERELHETQNVAAAAAFQDPRGDNGVLPASLQPAPDGRNLWNVTEEDPPPLSNYPDEYNGGVPPGLIYYGNRDAPNVPPFYREIDQQPPNNSDQQRHPYPIMPQSESTDTQILEERAQAVFGNRLPS